MKIILAILLLLPSLVFANTRDGLVGWWKLDEGTGTSVSDSSWKGNTGTFVSAPTWNVNCKRDKCLSFNGTSDYVTVADSASLTLTSAMSLSMWFKTSTSVAVSSKGLVVKDDLSTKRAWLFIHQISSDAVGFGSSTGAALCTIIITGSAVDGLWHHYVGTADGTVIRLYKDGVEASNGSCVGTITASAGVPVTIGAFDNVASRFSTGQIDDVRIYNRTLSVQEVKDLYNAGVKVGYAPNI